MITYRPLEPSDMPTLALSLAADEHHKGTEPEFFTEIGSVCNVYEDAKGPVFFLRGSKALRLDIQYVSNQDAKRNMAAMIQGFPALVDRARSYGFTEVVFVTSNDFLKKFCEKRLGFTSVSGHELRRMIA
jgi:hypothetical protein